MPAAPRTICPRSTTPPPRPVPTIAATEERLQRGVAEEVLVGVEGGGVAVVVVEHGQRQARLRSRRGCRSPTTPAAGSSWHPVTRSRPVALAGPGVSRPTASTAASGTPAASSAASIDTAMASRAASGPSLTRLGDSTMWSTRNVPETSSTVALVFVPRRRCRGPRRRGCSLRSPATPLRPAELLAAPARVRTRRGWRLVARTIARHRAERSSPCPS